MGTRGIYGFRLGGHDKLFYNQFDCYPSDLGEIMVGFANQVLGDPDTWRAKVEALRAVGEGEKPSSEIIAKAQAVGSIDLGVGDQSLMDWYCITRGCQSDPVKLLELGVFQNSEDFILDSLFCEYAYIINFDDGTIEFYEGFSEKPGAGRYGSKKEKPDSDYYGCRLVGTAPWGAIPADWAQKFYGQGADD